MNLTRSRVKTEAQTEQDVRLETVCGCRVFVLIVRIVMCVVRYIIRVTPHSVLKSNL